MKQSNKKAYIELLEGTLNATDHVILITDTDGNVIDYNEAAKKYAKKHNINLSFNMRETNLKVFEKIKKLIKTQKNQTMNVERSGKHYDINIYPIKNSKKELTKYVAIYLHDITKRIKTQDALLKTAEKLSTAERITKLGYWEMVPAIDRMYWSSEIYKIFGITPKEIDLNLDSMFEFIDEDDHDKTIDDLDYVLKNGGTKSGLFKIIRKDGSHKYCKYTVYKMIEENITTLYGTLQDLTELIETQNQLKSAIKYAEQTNKNKSRFLASASHDLRQPMQALHMFVDALSHEDLSDSQAKLVSKISSSADALRDLLDNLLDISKLDSGKIDNHPIDFHIGELIKQIAEEYTDIATQKDIKLKYIDINKIVHADPIHVERIIRNLLNNAIKYTNSGKVLIGGRVRNRLYTISIVDTGIGIATNKLREIFNEFFQINNPSRDKSKGVGLGLSIVKRLTTLIGSNIDVNSVESRGSNFSFSVPLSKKAPKIKSIKYKTPRKIKNEYSYLNIFIIDDDREIRRGLKAALSSTFDNIYTCSNGPEALRSITLKNKIPDIIISDYRLEDGEIGTDVIDAIRGKADQFIPAIILTADKTPHIAASAQTKRYSVVSKPTTATTLKKKIIEEWEKWS